MLIYAFILGILTSGFNALSAILERISSGRPNPKQLFSRHFMTSVTTSRLFLMGVGVQVLAFMAEALALHFGTLVIIEPLLTTDLVFLLVFIALRTNVWPGVREWSAVLLICGGLSGFYIIARPHIGHLTFNLNKWIIVAAVVTAFVLLCIYIVKKIKSAKGRALIGGMAASSLFALNASFTKLFVDQVKQYGLFGAATHWPVVALVITGVASLLLLQNVYAAGPLGWSQPTLEITSPLIAMVIGILLFNDQIKYGNLRLPFEILMGVVIAVGIALLTSSKKLEVAGRQGG